MGKERKRVIVVNRFRVDRGCRGISREFQHDKDGVQDCRHSAPHPVAVPSDDSPRPQDPLNDRFEVYRTPRFVFAQCFRWSSIGMDVDLLKRGEDGSEGLGRGWDVVVDLH